ncbi:ATP-binding protein [Streptomyces sp. NPDC001796]|uniref:ATP-binding protein n=1 Tax=Streptomyces sp. NPDC001796 TaxID=3364609 RepID=UPI00368E6C84
MPPAQLALHGSGVTATQALLPLFRPFPRPSRPVVDVADAGIGFARSRADHGSGQPQSSGRTGTGLGLAIVRAIVECHGGGLTVVSERPGGSLLRTELPLHPPAAEPRS